MSGRSSEVVNPAKPRAACPADAKAGSIFQLVEIPGPAAKADAPVPAFRVRLQYLFLPLRQAGWAYAVRRLATLITVLENIDLGAKSRCAKRIARHLTLKAIPLLNLALKREEAILYQRLIALGLDELVEKLQQDRLRLGIGRSRTAEDLLEALGRVSRAGKCPGAGSCEFDDGGDVDHVKAPDDACQKTSVAGRECPAQLDKETE
ncbi:MAG: hypothetical protein HLUCCO07_03435 [Rhodobacteraceae bacterium HLUCCO07]|nr:MAG: hypothetical protein HLUCCO07_03435 [Rhodobacteraceae bacterium HLUCCO07]